MDPFADALHRATAAALAFRAGVAERPVGRPVDPAGPGFDGPLPRTGTPPGEVVDALVAAAEPGLVASVGPRYFGFVVGGALSSATAADVLAAAWDQNAFTAVMSPAAAAAERTAGRWLVELLGLPSTASVGFVTGGQAANTVGLAAGRHHVLAAAGWDVEADGLGGAPPLRIVASEERHATVDRAARLLGLGRNAVDPVSTRPDGAIDVADLARVLRTGSGPAVVCLQSGNVNTGACDDLRAAVAVAREHGAWVHVDGAFGLWAAAAPTLEHLVDGRELADSWACDGHKWLNVPYDCGFAICAHPATHAAALGYTAAYLPGAGDAQLGDLVPESSRRARGFAVWAALRELGADGVAEVVERGHRLARRFADRLAAGGVEIPAPVVLNQVLAGFGDRTDEVIAAVQADGTCWAGGTTWRGRRWMRLSVSNATTAEEDVDRSAAAVLRIAAR
ncbi:pyridoxal phosphate-dependent decarboxylase family protein [Pseudonocardia xishanensis]|uniref:Pyridoxal-dependent decarboxylase n=1 Tax=Pseudonocardia xishanensis TaxID=630995 RepID=A0ABP8RKC8_9PSEU